MRRLLSRTAILTLAIACLILGLRWISRVGNPSPAILSALQCAPQPCWHAIYPGKTRLDEARTILQGDPALEPTTVPGETLCWANVTTRLAICLLPNADGRVDGIKILSSAPLRLGDMLAVFGQPAAIRFCYKPATSLAIPPFLFMNVYFPGGPVVATGYRYPFNSRGLAPDQRVENVSYSAATELQSGSYIWRGFGWIDRLRKSNGCQG